MVGTAEGMCVDRVALGSLRELWEIAAPDSTGDIYVRKSGGRGKSWLISSGLDIH